MNYIPYVGKLLSNFRGFYNDINSATLTGAIDVIIIQQEDGSYISSPFHVRFGKLGVLRSREKKVDIAINGTQVDLQMKLGEAGEAFFVHEAAEGDEIPAHLATSPLPSYNAFELMEQGLAKLQALCDQVEEREQHTKLEVISDSEGDPSCPRVTDWPYMVIRHVACQTGADTPIQGVMSPEDSIYFSVEEMPSDEITQVLPLPLAGAKQPPEMVTSETQTDALPDFSTRKKMMRRRRKVVLEGIAITDSTSSSSSESNRGVFSMEEDDVEVDSATLREEVDKARLTEAWAKSQFASDVHPWSDADVTPNRSPAVSRPPSPKSDTELEIYKSQEDCHPITQPEALDWKWGQFPQPLQQPKVDGPLKEDHHTSVLFQFMRRTKKIRHQPEKEGLYLEDLSLEDMDPEVAQLYVYGSSKHTAGLKRSSLDAVVDMKDYGREDDNESGRGGSLSQSPVSLRSHSPPVCECQPAPQKSPLGQVCLSLCGGNVEEVTDQKFDQALVSYFDLSKDPGLLTNPKLIVRISGKFYTWQAAAPILVSWAAFAQSLPQETVDSLQPKSQSTKDSKKEGKKRGWGIWSWRGTEDPASLPPQPPPTSQILPPDPPVPTCPPLLASVQSSTADTDNGDKKFAIEEMVVEMDENMILKKYTKSLKLTSEEIEKLHLKPGQNTVTFSVTSRYQGTARTQAHIYLWRWDDKIIVSDVDGTITKSDVLGQVLPLVGKDWSQAGITNLYSRIFNNGYKFLYLSARAIGQSHQTRQLLNNVIQERNLPLPPGPLLLTPNSLVYAFYREVIERKPQEFKIGCLNDVKALFPLHVNPLYAGFGNRVTDVCAYQAVGIPLAHIFTVNHAGEVRVEHVSKFMSSYHKLYDIVDHFFPPVSSSNENECAREFSNFSYWRDPLPNIDADIFTFEAAKAQKAAQAATKKTSLTKKVESAKK